MKYFSEKDIMQYSFGDCNIFAIALSRITGLKMVAFAKQVINEEEEKWDNEYRELECSHAALLIDDNTVLDVFGLRSIDVVIENCMWNEESNKYHGNVFLEKFESDECEDISSYFASYEEELIEDAIEKIKSSQLLDLIK